jgi:hypothetical protein
MRTAGIFLLLAALPAGAQFAARPASAIASIDQPRFSTEVIRNLEKEFDKKLASAAPSPFYPIGATRGVYIPGYGLIFTAELDLMQTRAAGGLLNSQIADAEVVSTHAKKLAQLPLLQQFMRDLVTSTAQKVDMIPESERIVFAVRLWYQGWEDRTRLPERILMTADRKSAKAGLIQEVPTK